MNAKLLSLGLMSILATPLIVASSVQVQAQEQAATATESGCADWPSGKFIQTPWAKSANGGTGMSQAGPSYYGEGWHVNCNTTSYINQYYALDFPLNKGDIISAPAPGKVIWTGWTDDGWINLGRIVVVDLGGGYWSMSAHLSSIDVSVGQQVGANTVIGKVGASGGYIDNAGVHHHVEDYWSGPHLHQSIFLNAHLQSSDGGIYGGQSVQMHNVHYVGNGGGTYQNISKYQPMSW